MNTLRRAAAVAAALALFALGLLSYRQHEALRELTAKLESLDARAPDQAAVMTIEAFQFSSLWFAIQAQNWPMADFFLNEARKDLRWAVRVKPLRKDAQGHDVDVAAIAEALDKTQLESLKSAIGAKDRAAAEKAYKQTLAGCQACHQASERGFLRPKIPTAPAVTLLSFEEGAPLPD